ncbi:hypothetical protein [Escherichia phage vB_vPM_PD112]|uniref:Uncharacterized protein n=1 Tax=Escherichia phage vB_vPM_PD112 TaxID=2315580 RepID=A0A386KMH5_9CAUD|nr:hypothetical protein KMC20_gp259 [Escherichia phage vB_vPM_PD112]AYD85417.1 hypothetical protein [Escherichia phage vB_vPM_PD112]
MNYNEIVDELVDTIQSACSIIPEGYYRRVKWELYNPNKEMIQPDNGVEWDTEIIKLDTHLYTENPFGHSSDTFTESSDGETQTGVFCHKIGVYFPTQTALEDYVEQIGATLLPGNTWYGADLSKREFFKTEIEYDMYRIENRGGTWHHTGPRIDARTMIGVNNDYTMYVNFNGLGDYRRAYLKYYEDKPCTYVGLTLNLNIDTSIPGIPYSPPSIIGELPLNAISCVNFTAQFPYNGLTSAIIEAWNTSRDSFKLYWDMLPGMPAISGSDFEKYFNSAYTHLSVAMEELGNSAIAMCQYVQQQAFMVFKNSVSQVLNIVGGGWDLLKSFLPKITIMGISIDIEDLCTSTDGVQKLKETFENFNLEDTISSIYSAMGSAYDYSIERVKMYSRDLVDAITDLYDWAWSKLMMAGVALSKLCVDLAQIWSMPPIIPNPVWSVITLVKEMMKQIPPLDMIMSGNFPGFTASDVYQMVMSIVSEKIKQVYTKIESLKTQALDVWNEIKLKTQEYKKQTIEFKQYLSGMAEKVEDEITIAKKKALQEAESALNVLKDKYNSIKDLIKNKQISVSDVLDLALTEFRKIPLISQMESLLSLAGASIDDIMKVYENSVTKAKSLYHEFTDGARSMKDLCKSLYNQISTLCLSKVVQWINKMLGIFGLSITFPTVSICIPCLKTPMRN